MGHDQAPVPLRDAACLTGTISARLPTLTCLAQGTIALCRSGLTLLRLQSPN